MDADALDVGDEVLGGIGVGRKIGVAAAGATLIEQDGVEALRIEQQTMAVLRSAARAAVQKDSGNSATRADFLHVKPMAVADSEHDRIEWARRFGGKA
jgi:hypothetical protein